jgi:hypothetical protein
VERAPREDPIEESFELRFGQLMREALRLLAALGDAPAFPTDIEGVERLLAAVVPKDPDLLRGSRSSPAAPCPATAVNASSGSVRSATGGCASALRLTRFRPAP